MIHTNKFSSKGIENFPEAYYKALQCIKLSKTLVSRETVEEVIQFIYCHPNIRMENITFIGLSSVFRNFLCIFCFFRSCKYTHSV